MSTAEHEQKWADMPRIGGKPMPVPPDHPDHATVESDEDIAADMDTIQRLSRIIIDAVSDGAAVTLSKGLVESHIDQYLEPWPTA